MSGVALNGLGVGMTELYPLSRFDVRVDATNCVSLQCQQGVTSLTLP